MGRAAEAIRNEMPWLKTETADALSQFFERHPDYRRHYSRMADWWVRRAQHIVYLPVDGMGKHGVDRLSLGLITLRSMVGPQSCTFQARVEASITKQEPPRNEYLAACPGLSWMEWLPALWERRAPRATSSRS
jgi:hypothetical protein